MKKFAIVVTVLLASLLHFIESLVIREVDAYSDEVVTLQCRMDKEKVGWWHIDKYLTIDNKTITMDSAITLNSRYELIRNLELRNIKQQNEGKYKCQEITSQTVREEYLILIKKSATIDERNITRSPKLVLEGHRVDLWCNASGVPAPTVKWYAKGDDTTVDINISGPKLRIYNISRECGTQYICEADNNYPPGREPAKKEIRLQVQFPPEVSIHDTENAREEGTILYRNVGDRISLRCTVLANPNATIRWMIETESLGQRSVLAKVNAGDKTYQKLTNTDQQAYDYVYDFSFEQTGLQAFFDMKFIVDAEFTFSKYTCEATSNAYNGNMFMKSVRIDRVP